MSYASKLEKNKTVKNELKVCQHDEEKVEVEVEEVESTCYPPPHTCSLQVAKNKLLHYLKHHIELRHHILTSVFHNSLFFFGPVYYEAILFFSDTSIH